MDQSTRPNGERFDAGRHLFANLVRHAAGDGAALKAPRIARRFRVFKWMSYDVFLPNGTQTKLDVVLASRRRWAQLKADGELDRHFHEETAGPFVFGWRLTQE